MSFVQCHTQRNKLFEDIGVISGYSGGVGV